MIIILLIFTVFIVFFAMYFFSDDYDSLEDAGIVGSWVFGVILTGFLIAIPLTHYGTNLQIAKFEARKQTIYQQREKLDTDYERAMLTVEIVNDNGWLANIQKNKELLWFNWYIPKSILEVEPIK